MTKRQFYHIVFLWIAGGCAALGITTHFQQTHGYASYNFNVHELWFSFLFALYAASRQ